MTENKYSGALRKMPVRLEEGRAVYSLQLDEQTIDLNEKIGTEVKISSLGKINCVHCGRVTKKSFNQGYCFPCFKSLARCDQCIVSPEKCHYHEGTCREPTWGEEFCMQDHIVYLANSSGLKIGITRVSQVPTRWIDQGAVAAIPVYRTSSRQISGFVEQAAKDFVADKTNWRAMLKGIPDSVDLIAERERIHARLRDDIDYFQEQEGLLAVQELTDIAMTEIEYPVDIYPEKVASFNLDKQPEVQGLLTGIKGQYLIFDGGVINIRKYGGYQVSVEFKD